jgi:Mn-dependent DtxR family transcriptional regulator
MVSPGEERYLETIYYDVIENGYSSVSEIASSLKVSVSSVTKMVQKLGNEEYLDYKRYGKIRMTEKGLAIGERLANNHKVLEEFYRKLGFTNEEEIYEEISTIEYHMSERTIAEIREFLDKDKKKVNRSI